MITYIYKPDLYSSHSKIIKFVNLIKKNNLKILDMGCAQGYLAKELKLKGHEIIGIEIDPRAASEAKKFCKKIFIGDLDIIKPKLEHDFDLIIFGDVLEHLKNPNEILKYYLQFLNQDGFVIASTSNIANIYIRLNLLLGKFNYENRGILDKTHLHLYTLKTFKQLLKKSKLKIIKTDVAPIPLPMVISSTAQGKPLNFIHQINYLLAKIWKTLVGFQFIVLSKKIN